MKVGADTVRKKCSAITGVAHLRSNTKASITGGIIDFNIFWDGSESHDSEYYDISSDKQKIFIKETGIYQITAFVRSYIRGNAGAFLRVNKNGVNIYGIPTSSNFGRNDCAVILTQTLTAGDCISVYSSLAAWSGDECGINEDSVITFTKTK